MTTTINHSDISQGFMDTVVKILDDMRPGESIDLDKLKNKGLPLSEKEIQDFIQVVRWYTDLGWEGEYNQIDLSTTGNKIFMTTVRGFKRKSIISRHESNQRRKLEA